MFNTFLISYKLRNTYKTNGIIYRLKSIPLLKKLLPTSLYASSGLKIFANIVSSISEFFSIFIWKGLYLLLVFLAAIFFKSPSADNFAHILIFLTIIGGLINTSMFNPTKDKFYAIYIMRMDAKKYVLTDYLYFLLKTFIGFLAFSLIFGLLSGMSTLTYLLIPTYVIGVKLCFSAYSLYRFDKPPKNKKENSFSPLLVMSVILLLLAAFLPLFLGYSIKEEVFIILTLLIVIPTGFCLKYILSFDNYRWVYKELLQPDTMLTQSRQQSITQTQKETMQGNITADPIQTSKKTGYKYFNDIFIKRHSKLLTKTAKVFTIIAIAIYIAVLVFLFTISDAEGFEGLNKILHSSLPYFLFIMYIINRGEVITQAMFMNCDSSMLTYRFYRQPDAILSLFIERLKSIILINLMPASVIALALSSLLFITGGTNQPINYILIFVSIIMMSVFFSVHTIVLYYLLQPYNKELEAKSFPYSIVNTVTYILCYFAISLKIPTIIFCSAITAFCLIYVIIAFILAYRLAPKTFKLRQ